MDALELLDLISHGEDSRLQFKQDLTNPDQVAAELAAFANTLGGKLLVGVADDSTVVGVSPADVVRINDLISNAAAHAVQEPLYPTSEVVKVQGKAVIVVDVRESDGKPHFDRNGVVWVKTVGNKRRVTAREELRRLFQEVDLLHADDQAVKGTTENDLHLDRFDAFYGDQFGRSFRDEGHDLARILNNLNLARGTELTLAGLLLFGQEPQRYRPELIMKAVAFAENDPATNEYLDSEDIAGTLPAIFERSQGFLARNIRRKQGGSSFNSTAIPEIHPTVVEELLVNALVHRNYFISASWNLFIFPDRVEFISPGSLPNNLTVEHAVNGTAVARNPVLLSLCAKGLLPYRGIGTGLPRVLRSCPEAQVINEAGANRFRVVVPRKGSV